MVAAATLVAALPQKPAPKKAAAKSARKFVAAKPQPRVVKAAVVRAAQTRRIATGPWRVPTYADSKAGDNFSMDDPLVRRAAVEALSSLNGSIVVAEAETGRVLTIVNQKLAFRDGFEPCSTIKVPVALGALSEMIVERNTPVRLNRWKSIDLTDALAKSNNEYFASMGEQLGFDRVSYYAHIFGLGEKAAINLDEEQPGRLPAGIPRGGLGMMTSFGEGISQTPLQLAAEMVAVANGGTLFYLQYPRSEEQAETFMPRIKRQLDFDPLIQEVLPGLKGAVDYGTARRIDETSEHIFGKTGTCTDERSPTHLGWFGSFMDTPRGKIVAAVLLTGGRPVSGPLAAGVAGQFYHNLEINGYFLARGQQTEASLIPGFPGARTYR